LSKEVTQNDVIQAARITKWIEQYGTQPRHMTKAVRKLAPDLEMLFKNKSSIDDLVTLVAKKSWPVAVNWQGLYYDTPEEEPSYPGPDNGHYCIVVDIQPHKDKITLLDPYPDFSQKPRTFSLSWFENRWWDIAEEKDTKSGKRKKIVTDKLLFMVTPADATFPQEVGAMPYSRLISTR
jgi:hypothetical protein